jgi:ribosomal protein L33
MIYDLDEILKEKLTKDRECRGVYDNLRGLYATGTVETRHYGEEREIKLNRLERKETPMKVRTEGTVMECKKYCPVCGHSFDYWLQVSKYCPDCGQRLML